jgi:exodeoxyribonuclease V alpha subunit
MPQTEACSQNFSELDRYFGRLMEKLSGGTNPAVFLAAVLASRSSREGHVCLDLAGIAGKQLIPDLQEGSEGGAMPESMGHFPPVCPTLSAWEGILRASPVVGWPGEYRPLILDGRARLYLYRYWFYEDTLIRFLEGCARSDFAEEFHRIAGKKLSWPELEEILDAVFPEETLNRPERERETELFPNRQKLAALAVLRKPFVVISGSPGTGKTTTAARIIALLDRLSKGQRLRIALAAPTGKAAVRLEEAMKQACVRFNPDFLPGKAMTLHRLLGVIPNSPYFRHRRENPLPYDLVVVDEASMVDLPLMAKLVSALAPASRLILLGDRDQLASVEAGAVLGDLCGPEYAADFFSQSFLEELRKMTGDASSPPVTEKSMPPIADSIISLRKNYRFAESSGIGQLSRAVNGGDVARVFSILKYPSFADIDWQPLPDPLKLTAALKEQFTPYFKEYLRQAGIGGDPDPLFEKFERFRILCALRQGPFGVAAVNALLENMLRQGRAIAGERTWYPGRPVMITRNDYGLGLFNGDVGLTLPGGSGRELSVFFRDPEKGFRRFAPFRLPEHETVYAMTLHKSQGSEFNEVLLILSDPDTPLLTRELVYTGVTRAKERLTLWGHEDVLRQAVSRRISRVSGLRDALWNINLKSTD